MLCKESNYEKQMKYTRSLLLVVTLSVAMLTGLSATSLAIPVFAIDEKECEDNRDNNCNDTHKTQKIRAKNDCSVENYNKDHSKHNENLNELVCVNEAQNLKDVLQEPVRWLENNYEVEEPVKE
jgi:hypothetical protein